jgi:hypothetical protein
MADDAMAQLLSALGGAGAGGTGAVVAVRFLFASFKEQLTELTQSMKALIDTANKRHEENISERANMKASIEAAHRRIDALEAAVHGRKRR